MMYIVIPFRKGSKRIKDKNIKELGNKPLFIHSVIRALNMLKYYDDLKIILKTDYDKAFIQSFLDIFHLESPHLSIYNVPETSDTEPATEYIDRIIADFKLKDNDNILLLQPTCPLRSDSDLMRAISLYRSGDSTSLVSVTEVSTLSKLYESNLSNQKYYVSSLSNDTSYDRFKVNSYVYKRNSSIYIFNIRQYLLTGTIFNKISSFITMPWWRSVDIDTPEDFAAAELLLNMVNKRS